MNSSATVKEPELERQGRRITRPALRFLAIALVIAIPGIVLVVVGHAALLGLGIARILLGTSRRPSE